MFINIVFRLEDVFGGSDRDVEKHDLCKLVYLEAVIKESMRIIPIVPVIARQLDRNVKLSEFFTQFLFSLVKCLQIGIVFVYKNYNLSVSLLSLISL